MLMVELRQSIFLAASRCLDTCKHFLDRGDIFCFIHGTVLTKQQPWDAINNDDVAVNIHVADKRILQAFRAGVLNAREIAIEFGVTPNTVYKCLTRHGIDTIAEFNKRNPWLTA